jgi:cytochrome c oxidase accessory protein FixG
MAPAAVLPPPRPPEPVLPTLNPDGSRRWLRPRLSRGRYLQRRRQVAWGLIVLFTAIPYLELGGKPLVLLDVARRQFTLFGTTFLPTDTVLLMLLLVGIFLGIFLLTAVYGRVWCGWGCPQTVYMEFVYRPLERLIEGPPGAQARFDGARCSPRRVVKAVVFLGVSMFLAHTFLAYFVGVSQLRHWIGHSPVEHPIAFPVMAGTTLLMLLDFGWLREQVCLVACPYGRFQSVLLDRRSLIVGYDTRRGEPRGPYRRRAAKQTSGDCVDCRNCVTTCPTGIDIRQGLQMECIHCTQCIDACDTVMDRLGRPRGLVRYTSRAELAGEARRFLRPRVVFYPLLLVAVWGALAVGLAHHSSADVTVLRGLGGPFAVLPSGEVSNEIRIKIVNRGTTDRRYLIELADDPSLRLVAPENPVPVPAGKAETAVVFVTAHHELLEKGERPIRIRVSDGAGFTTVTPYRLLGPSRPEWRELERREHRSREPGGHESRGDGPRRPAP